MRLLASLIILAAAILLPASSWACSCRGQVKYDAVFEGRVAALRINQKSPDRYTEARFTVTRRLQGKVGKQVTVYSPIPVIVCGIVLEAGKSYLVYAMRVGKQYETKDCYGTQELLTGGH